MRQQAFSSYTAATGFSFGTGAPQGLGLLGGFTVGLSPVGLDPQMILQGDEQCRAGAIWIHDGGSRNPRRLVLIQGPRIEQWKKEKKRGGGHVNHLFGAGFGK